jgi:multiple sugar transport system permease protein
VRLRPGPALRHGAALLAALLFVLPLVWAVSTSLRPTGLPPPRQLEWLPRPLAWSNYVEIFRVAPLGRYLGNSLLVAAVAVPLTLLVASWAGFALAQLPSPLRERLVGLTVVLLLAPIGALWLVRFLLFSALGLIDTLVPLVAPALMGGSPLFVLLYYWTFRRLPRELLESARLDGASAPQIWAAVAMPLAGPSSAAVAVLAFALFWGDLISPLMYLKSERRYTLPVGLSLLQQLERSSWPLLLAAAVVMTVPVVGLFLLVQRRFWPQGRAER